MPDKISQDKSFSIVLDNEYLSIKGELTIDNSARLIPQVHQKLKNYNTSFIKINLKELDHIDSSGVVALYILKEQIEQKKISVDFHGADNSIEQKLELFKPPEKKAKAPVLKTGLFEKTGDKAYRFVFDHVGNFIQLVADIVYWSVRDIFNASKRRKGEVTNQAVNVGVNALPIIVGMSFIIGLVLALQSAAQLRDFGADIFIVDLTVIAMMSEMGPLITAILVAGRSGSAIAAEIATMKVTNELDALQTMGLNPLRFVVVPKVYGSIITMPFLTVFANVAGIIGGMTAAYFYLGITPEVFFNRMADSLYNKDIITGIVKSLVFACLIVFTGSYFGFIVKRGAEGVGKVTTKSVVVAISLVIIADSIMGLLFY